VGLAHGAISFAFVCALAGVGTVQGAAATSLFIHGAWMVWRLLLLLISRARRRMLRGSRLMYVCICLFLLP
jgi:hypothetical protein